MRTRQRFVVLGVALLVASGFAVAARAATPDPSAAPDAAAADQAARSVGAGALSAQVSGQIASAVVPSAVRPSACRDGAEAPAPSGDARYVEMWRGNPASHAVAGGNVAADAVGAVTIAKLAASGGHVADLAPAPAGAVKMSWARAAASTGDDVRESLVATDRCVWLVTVQGSFTPRSMPRDAKARVYPSVTVVLDGASGEPLVTVAGGTAPSVMTGAGVAVETVTG